MFFGQLLLVLAALALIGAWALWVFPAVMTRPARAWLIAALVLILVCIMAAAAATPARAQAVCMPEPQMLAMLQGAYGEQVVMRGAFDETTGVLVTRSDNRGTFTILFTQRGVACINYSGKTADRPA